MCIPSISNEIPGRGRDSVKIKCVGGKKHGNRQSTGSRSSYTDGKRTSGELGGLMGRSPEPEGGTRSRHRVTPSHQTGWSSPVRLSFSVLATGGGLAQGEGVIP